jgi:hypothetical protein
MDIKKIVAKVKTKIAEDKNFFKMSDIEKFFKDSLQLPMKQYESAFIFYNPNNGRLALHSGAYKGDKANYKIVVADNDHQLFINNDLILFKSAKECFKKIEAIETGKEKLNS